MKKIASLVMIFLMAFSFMPWSVFAEESEAVTEDPEPAIEEVEEDSGFSEDPVVTEENENTELSDEGQSLGKEDEVTSNNEPIDIGEPNVPENKGKALASNSDIIDSGACGNNLTWTLDREGLLTITGEGSMSNYSYNDPTSIPWFNSRGNLTAVTIDNGVTSIGDSAFYFCSSLTNIEIPNSITNIGIAAFYDCSNLTNIEIPDSVTSIGDHAFNSCSNLTNIEIPENVTSIGEGAFFGCSSLTNIEIPEGVTSIGNLTFYGCTSIQSVSIPSSVKTIGENAFSNCDSLKDIYYPGVASSWNEIDIKAGNDSIINATKHDLKCGDNAYWEVQDGTLRIFGTGPMYDYSWGKPNQPWYDDSSIKEVVIEEGITYIGKAAFCGNNYGFSISSVILADTVTCIGEDAFYSQYELKTISPLTNVTTIERSAFSHCEALISPIILPNIETIGEWGISSCYLLREVELGPNLSEIADNAFQSDNRIERIYCICGSFAQEWANSKGYTTVITHNATKEADIDPTCTEPGLIQAEYCSECGMLMKEQQEIPATGHSITAHPASTETCTEDGNIAYWSCDRCGKLFSDEEGTVETTEEAVVINKLGHNYEDGICTRCGAIETIAEGDGWVLYVGGLLNIEKMPSYGDAPWRAYKEEIKQVNIENSVTSIGPGAFSGCSSLISIEIPNRVTSIGPYAFSNCSSLTSIRIPVGVISIESGTFSGCSNLSNIYIPYCVTTIGDDAFSSCDSLTSIEIPDSVTTIGNHAFNSCDSLTNIEIPDSVTTIGDLAFGDCSSLTNIAIPNSVTSIGDYAFSSCYSLASIEIPNSLTSIGDHVFSTCINLTNIEIPNSVTSIGNDAFSSCHGLTSIAIPDSVTSIGDYAFSRCSSLTNIEIPESVTSIGAYAFSGCGRLKSITLPEGVTSIGTDAFGECDSLTSIFYGGSEEAWNGMNVGSVGHAIVHYEASDHTYGDLTIIAATCTEDGLSAHYECSVCHALFVKEGNDYIEKTADALKIPAIGHNLEEHAAVEPTCTTVGNNAYWSCERCSKVFADEAGTTEIALIDLAIPAKGHTEEAIAAVAATCVNTGLTEGKKCSVCGEILEAPEEVAALGHDWEDVAGTAVAATCTEDGKKADQKCSRCGEVQTGATIEATGHTKENIPAVEPTCTETGSTAGRKCSICGEILEAPEEVAALGHDWEDVAGTAVAATCTEDGKKADKKCTRCDSEIAGASIEALGHAWSEWETTKEATEEEEGLEVRVCEHDPSHVEERSIPKLNHTHDFVKTEAAEATCTADGNIEYWICSKCGKFFSDAEGTREIEENSWVIPAAGHDWTNATCTEPQTCKKCGVAEGAALGHDYKEVAGTAKAATCTEAGKEADQECSRCHDRKIGAAIAAIGHTLTAHVAKAATCTAAGNIAYWSCDKCGKFFSDVEGTKEIEKNSWVIPAAGHDWTYATCTEPQTCKKCGVTEGAALGHDYQEVANSAKAATCTEAGKEADKKCSRCDSEMAGATIEALGHAWGEWRTTKEATEEEEGLKARVCEHDPSHVEERTIPKLNHTHDLVKTEASEATCTADGNIEYWTCSKCGRSYSDANAENEIDEADTIIAALGHDYQEVANSAKAATCTEAGKEADKKCSRCDSEMAGAAIEALGHDWGSWQVLSNPTCKSVGTRARYCNRCNDEQRTEIEKLKHIWKDVYEVDKPATCTEEGSESIHCTVCNISKEDTARPIEKTPHNYGKWEITKDATCKAAGVRQRKCADCDYCETEEIAALGHAEETIEAVAATCTAKGSTACKECSVCGEILEALEEVAALGHDYKTVEGSAVAATCEKAGKEADQECSRCHDKKAGAVIPATGHTLTAHEANVATREADGNIAYWSCDKCGKFFSDAKGTLEISKDSWVIPKIVPSEEEKAITQAIEEATAQATQASEAAAAAEKSTDEKVVGEAESSAEKAAELAAVAEARAEAEFNKAEAAYKRAEQGGDAAQKEAAKSDLGAATENLAAAKAAKAAANSALAKAMSAAANIALSKAAKASEAAAVAGDSAAAEALRKEATAQAAVAAEKATSAETASAAVSKAAAELGDLAGKVQDPDIKKKVEEAKADADKSADTANDSAKAAESSSEQAKASEAKAKEAVDEKAAAEKAAAEEQARQGVYDKAIPKVKAKKPASKKTSVTMKWTKLTKKQLKKSKATKYEIWLCPNTKFAKEDTTEKIVSKSKSSYTFKKLKKNTKYYVKVRAIRYVDGVKHVGKWSSRKTIKTKKK